MPTASHQATPVLRRLPAGAAGTGGTIGALVLASVSVVVILGAIVATIVRAVLAEDAQPPTKAPRERRGRSLGEDIELVAAADVRIEDKAAVTVVLDASTPWWRRAQSMVLLALLVTALGVVAAGLLAVLVVGGASLLDSALG